VHFVDDVHLVASRGRHVHRVLEELAHVVDLRVDAASSSIKSTKRPLSISTHAGHFPHGVSVGPCSQFSAFAMIRAIVVLPTPRVPVKRYA
jgi:hypothetical protein